MFEDMTSVVLWLWMTVSSINAVFVCFLFYRRLARKRYYAIKDSARTRYQPVINRFHSGQLTVEQATDLLSGATSQAERNAVEELVLETIADADRQRMTELLLGMGYVERWAMQAYGRRRGREVVRSAIHGRIPSPRESRVARVIDAVGSIKAFSVPRAIALDHLGWMEPSLARVFAAVALRDSSLEVRSTAISVIGRNRDRDSIPLLIQQLALAVSQKSDVSLRTIKVALVSYRTDDLPYFVPYLTHELPRARFFLVDAISQICARATREPAESKHESSRRSWRRAQSSSGRTASSRLRSGRISSTRSSRGMLLNKNDFSRAFYMAFVEQVVKDPFADVRARCAGVLRHFRDARAAAALKTLLQDENEFVRLHAARACGDRAYAALSNDLARFLSDPKWRVREAAAQSLYALGSDGVGELYKRFVTTDDRYASEQITDEIQRSGAIENLAAALVSSNTTLPLYQAVCRKMILMGKTSLLLNAMASPGVPGEARAFIMSAMLPAPPAEFLEVVQHIAATDPGPLGMKAQSILETPSGSTPAASGVGGA